MTAVIAKINITIYRINHAGLLCIDHKRCVYANDQAWCYNLANLVWIEKHYEDCSSFGRIAKVA